MFLFQEPNCDQYNGQRELCVDTYFQNSGLNDNVCSKQFPFVCQYAPEKLVRVRHSNGNFLTDISGSIRLRKGDNSNSQVWRLLEFPNGSIKLQKSSGFLHSDSVGKVYFWALSDKNFQRWIYKNKMLINVQTNRALNINVNGAVVTTNESATPATFEFLNLI
jgi:hypothetical protein